METIMAKDVTHDGAKRNGRHAVAADDAVARVRAEKANLPGQVVLVLQGGGALGAYQIGVYQALHEAGIEPDWVIGTSIGAINGALIAGNEPADRLERIEAFWSRMQSDGPIPLIPSWLAGGNFLTNLSTVTRGIPAFFRPAGMTLGGIRAEVGVEKASYYSTAPLRETLCKLVDIDYLCECHTRLTVGAVNACTGKMHYFDNRDKPLTIDHVMASGALPPAFPAVRIDGEPYWDGGIFSNTPIEAVLDDYPRRSSLIFAVNVWHQSGPEPESIWQVMGRHKDISYASRADTHIAKQKELHFMRHVISALYNELPATKRNNAKLKELASWGCKTTMHIAHLMAPRIDGEDHTKDIDFTTAGVQARRHAGYADALRMIERAPWLAAADPMQGVIEHV
jgi:NTE family protein